MPRIEVVTEINAPIARVFDLSRSIDVHQESQTHHRERAIAGRTAGLIEQGEQVTWEATHFGIRQRLTSRIVEMRPPTYFRDSLVKGAFKRFDHDHHFESLPDGRTRVRDSFDFNSPFGPFGRVVDHLILKRYMRRLIVDRNQAIKRMAEAAS
ncbi:MAG TPA: SRPBCC family protein [Opitutaceae bacterium]|jgi:ligand-binding SRPBCC domain-containing protein